VSAAGVKIMISWIYKNYYNKPFEVYMYILIIFDPIDI